jgi:hypothetical protein
MQLIKYRQSSKQLCLDYYKLSGWRLLTNLKRDDFSFGVGRQLNKPSGTFTFSTLISQPGITLKPEVPRHIR